MGAGLQIGGALGSRRARRRSAQPMSEINVTPMVDVMLVLLIIFMVTAPMLTVGLNLEPQPDLPRVALPKTEAGPVDAQKQVLARIKAAGIPVTLVTEPVAPTQQ